MYRFALLASFVVCLFSNIAAAQEMRIPQALQPWEQWVMYGEEFRRCPMRNGSAANESKDFVCHWPGRLRVEVTSSGGQFSQEWLVYAESWISLPGDETHWPERVEVDGKSTAIVVRDGIPQMRLSPGRHAIRGNFVWSRRPESLSVPLKTALVDLTIDGRHIAPVEIRHGRLWLGAVRTLEQPRALEMQVYRLLQDGSPIELFTRLQLKVSGDAREELLARVLPEGFVPLATEGALPFRFEPDGRLRMQVRSGEHVVTIRARAATGSSRFVLPSGEGLWAQEEIWGYRSEDRLRITAIEGAQPIDPRQAGVPFEWQYAPTYRLPRGATVAIAERSRGLNREDANRLTLTRDLWLAFDRRSFDAVDHVSGTMQQDWRLDMRAPYRLLTARSHDDTMLITDQPSDLTGIEIRTPELNVTTLARLPNRGAMPTTGWNARFENVSATLHLPAGHRLLAAWGADDSPNAWLDRWELLDVFLLMLISVAAFKLLGWIGGTVALFTIALTYHEVGAARWLWINALVAIAIVRALPEGRFRTWIARYRTLSIAALAFVLLPFAILQYRLALHPQLSETPSPSLSAFSADQPFGLEAYVKSPDIIDTRAIEQLAVPEVTLDVSRPSSSLRAVAMEVPAPMEAALVEPRRLDRYAPDAMLQTGPGTPDWQILRYELLWRGPVDPSQTLRLTIVTPLWLSLWRIAGIVLSGLLLLALIKTAFGLPGNWQLPKWRTSASAALIASLAVMCAPDAARAQTPDPQTLAELKNRLIAPAKCAPACAEVVVTYVDANRDRLTIDLDVHAQAAVALGMPHAGPAWLVDRVLIDGRPADLLSRNGETSELPLTAGVHRISMVGRIASADELAIDFATPPRRISVRTQGWDSSGSHEGRLLNNALQLTRRIDTGTSSATLTPQRLPAFVRIQRRAYLNLDWTVTTRVERLAPEEGAFTLRIPVLPGEAVLTPGFEVRDGNVLVSMPASANVVEWDSTLDRVDRLLWTASSDQPWVEQWELVVSPTWHAEFAGTPAILSLEKVSHQWVNQFLPRPGESLETVITRPAASTGVTLAVDHASVSSTLAARLTNTTLEFGYRSTRGGRHEVRIPEDARVRSIKIDGQPLPLRPLQGVLPLTLTPGAHTVTIDFSQDVGAGVVSRPPEIDLGAEGTNVRAKLLLDADRWILFAWGSGIGTAVLYWSELILFIIVAVLLGRVAGTPLRTHDWLFLGLGLSTFSWWVLLVFATWVFVLARRDRWHTASRWRFNLLQTSLMALSIVALVILISAIPFSLLGEPDMGIRPHPGYDGLTWFMDRTESQLPRPIVISVSIWFYKLAMLVWALWLSFALLRWLPWGWKQFASLGVWRGRAAEQM